MTDAPGYATTLAFLLSQVGADVARRFEAALAEHGMAPREFAVLEHAARGPSVSQLALADTLGMHRNSMVTIVDRLEERGLVRRARRAEDRRAHDLVLTAKGRRMLAKVQAVAPELDRVIVELVGPVAAKRLTRDLRALADALGLTDGVHPSLARR